MGNREDVLNAGGVEYGHLLFLFFMTFSSGKGVGWRGGVEAMA